MSFDIEQVKARCARLLPDHSVACICDTCAAFREDLPDAIELIEEAVRLLEKASDPYPVGSTWYRDQQAFLAKAGSTKKTP